jgi:hypothetical protein
VFFVPESIHCLALVCPKSIEILRLGTDRMLICVQKRAMMTSKNQKHACYPLRTFNVFFVPHFLISLPGSWRVLKTREVETALD